MRKEQVVPLVVTSQLVEDKGTPRVGDKATSR
jgi:hypothetical protein